ncbi:MAG: hypothetical protein H7125_07685 [Proteobacteria bacterium]|nr:hypothetical protein [Burkholderiales bacterium]
MSKPAKPLPRFKTEAQERSYWEAEGRDSTQYLDWAKAQRVVLPNLKPSTKTISVRLPQHLLDAIKAAARRRPAAQGDPRVLPQAAGKGGTVPAVVGAELARAAVRVMRGERETR